MRNGIDLRKNIAITSSPEIKEICAPLRKHLDIIYFNYVKIFKDNSRIVLTDGPDFTERYYGDKKLYTTGAVLSLEQLNLPSVHYFCEFQDQVSFNISRNEFGLDNGVIITQPNPVDSTAELFYFATHAKNYGHVHLYMNNLDAFYRFILYFKEKAKKLIQQAEKDKFLIVTPKIEEIAALNKGLRDKIKFYSETAINKLSLNLQDEEVTLSKREVDCLYLTMKRKSAKEIGKILTLSPRTAEAYLSNLRLKVGCKNKEELISTFTNPLYNEAIKHCVHLYLD
jgi:LuxR family transcriptional regulator, quorum-sensing system regulator SolR